MHFTNKPWMEAKLFVGAGVPVVGAGGIVVTYFFNSSARTRLNPGALNPAYSHSVPWQPEFEQKDVLLVPPGSSTVWQLTQVASKYSRCREIQLELVCDSGSGPRLISILVRNSSAPATTGMEWHRLHSSLTASPLVVRCLPSWQRRQPGENLCCALSG